VGDELPDPEVLEEIAGAGLGHACCSRSCIRHMEVYVSGSTTSKAD
jgi:hypothetical protein